MNRFAQQLKWLVIGGLLSYGSTSIMAQEASSPAQATPVTSVRASTITPLMLAPRFREPDNMANITPLPLTLPGQVMQPCLSLSVGDVTMSFAKDDVETFVRLHAKYRHSSEQELVDAVWAAVLPAKSTQQCAEIPQTMPNYFFKDGHGQIFMAGFVRGVLDHLLALGKVAIRMNHTDQPITTIYVRVGQAFCPLCGRIPPTISSYRITPDSTPFWSGLGLTEYPRFNT